MRAVRDVTLVDPTTLPALYEFPPPDIRPDLDVTDSAEWWRGMPSLRTATNPAGTMDASAMEDELREAADAADLSGPGEMEALLSQRLGLESSDRGGGARATALSRYWAQCLDVDLLVPEHAPTVVALDPSAGLDDPFGLVTLITADGHYYAWSRQWLTRDAYTAAPGKLRETYDAAVAVEELFVVEGTESLEASVLEYCRTLSRNLSVQFGGDARGLAGFRERFQQALGADYQPDAQNWELMAALERISALAADGRLHHGGQPLLSANVENLIVENGRLKKYDGSSSGMGSAKIDGVMTLLSAVQLTETGAPAFSVESCIG